MKNRYQEEADQILWELKQDLNRILEEDSEDSLCQNLLYQELTANSWKGRYYGTYKGKLGYFQFVVDVQENTLTIGEEIQETA